MEAMDKPVKKVMLVERVTMIKVPIRPTFPTTQPKRRYMITPKMVRIEGVKTPPKVPNPLLLALVLFVAAFFTKVKGG
jgi:hypothetical protein